MTPLNEEVFAEAVHRMLTDSEFYTQKKGETLIEAEKWSSTTMAKKMIKAYENISQV